jgi:Holliday junction resolvase YEN1
MAKRLIKLFGFTAHDAPGEAEAECALLQREGVVDAVLSEDVDTIMFGCGMTLRSWSAESKGGTIPTHVTIYDSEEIKQGESKLDREGMVLVALMSGGDYIPEGIPGCGVKVACEAARAGFGRSLCRIKKSHKEALEQWKAQLTNELRTNEKGFFKTKHKALVIPEEFPNMDVLRYYTHPVVSQQAAVERLRSQFPSKHAVDIISLREFVKDTFDWTFITGAVKLVKLLAPGILVRNLLDASVESTASDDLGLVKTLESSLVKGITTKRSHFSAGGITELRVSYVPIDMVPLDLDAEPEEVVEEYGRGGLALNSDDEFEEAAGGDADEVPSSQASRKKKPFDPLQPDVAWIPESVVKLGTPLTVEDWEASIRAKERAKGEAAAAPRKGRARAPVKKKSDMPAGALDKWVKNTKTAPRPAEKEDNGDIEAGFSLPQPPFPLQNPARSILQPPHEQPIWLPSSPPELSLSTKPAVSTRSSPARKAKRPATSTKSFSSTSVSNPWAVTGSQVSGARVTKTIGALTPIKKAKSSQQEPILISSSPVAPSPPAVQPHLTSQPVHSHRSPSSPVSPKPRPARKSGRSLTAPAPPPSQTRQTSRAARTETLGKKQTSITAFGVVGRASTSTSSKTFGSQAEPFMFSSDAEDNSFHSAVSQPRLNKSTAPRPPRQVDSEDDEHEDSLPDLNSIISQSRTTTQGSKATRNTASEWEDLHDDEPPPPDKGSIKKVYIPRTSNVGFYREVSVSMEEAERLRRTNPRAFRFSDVSVVDLTEEP